MKSFVAKHTSAKNFTVVPKITPLCESPPVQAAPGSANGTDDTSRQGAESSVPAATDAAAPAVNVTGRFRRYDGRVFRDRCREAIKAKNARPASLRRLERGPRQEAREHQD